MRHHGRFWGLTWVLACAAALSFCAGGARNGESPPAPAASENTASENAPETASQAANDPAAAVPAAAEPESYDPATAVGAVKGTPAPTNSAPIEAVANFFTELPGFDLTSFEKHKREKFLHRVNSEMCTCGCKNDTLAHCLINDATCPNVKILVQGVYDEVKAGK